MKIKNIVSLCAGAATALGLLFSSSGAELEEVASFPTQQVTGVAVSPQSGRIFVNFPFWSDQHTLSVAEVMKDGSLKAFPDDAWNRKEGHPWQRFVCVQSVYMDDTDSLWILDAGSPKMEGVIKGGAKLLKVDLSTNKIVLTIPFDEEYAPKKSYLNDVRVDTQRGHVFLSESGVGSLLVVDLNGRTIRRVLGNHGSTKAERGVELTVDNIKPIDPETHGTPQFHADGIALDTKNGWLYYHALTGYTLYRINTSDLVNPKLLEEELAKKVLKVATTPVPDGMLADKEGRLYLTAIEKNAIVRFDPDSEKITTIVEDSRLQWPDSLSWGPEGDLYVTTSQIHRTPRFNQGVSKQKEPFRVYRVKLGKVARTSVR